MYSQMSTYVCILYILTQFPGKLYTFKLVRGEYPLLHILPTIAEIINVITANDADKNTCILSDCVCNSLSAPNPVSSLTEIFT